MSFSFLCLGSEGGLGGRGRICQLLDDLITFSRCLPLKLTERSPQGPPGPPGKKGKSMKRKSFTENNAYLCYVNIPTNSIAFFDWTITSHVPCGLASLAMQIFCRSHG